MNLQPDEPKYQIGSRRLAATESTWQQTEQPKTVSAKAASYNQEANEERKGGEGVEMYLLFLVFNPSLCVSPFIIYLSFIAHWQAFPPWGSQRRSTVLGRSCLFPLCTRRNCTSERGCGDLEMPTPAPRPPPRGSKALAALAEAPGSVPRPHMVAHYHPKLQRVRCCPLTSLDTKHTHMAYITRIEANTHVCKIK